MALECVADIDRYIGGTVRSAFRHPRLGPLLVRRALQLRIGFVEPDCVLDIDTQCRDVQIGTAGVQPLALVAMSADTANRFFQGRLDVESALRNGDIASDETGVKTLDAVLSGGWLPGFYIETLKRERGEDLLV